MFVIFVLSGVSAGGRLGECRGAPGGGDWGNAPTWVHRDDGRRTAAVPKRGMGALPALRAATDPQVRGGQYYGPSHLAEQRGYPRLVQSSAASHDERLQRWLWAVSEQSTGVTYPV